MEDDEVTVTDVTEVTDLGEPTVEALVTISFKTTLKGSHFELSGPVEDVKQEMMNLCAEDLNDDAESAYSLLEEAEGTWTVNVREAMEDDL